MPNPTALWQLGVDTGRAYASVSGDFNPIHLSVLSAKALGMRRSIAHGMPRLPGPGRRRRREG